jgi:protein-S-isoprenylcysteine O-methyltransferase Ste14
MHAYVRHPLYSGTLLFVWSIFVGYPYMNNLISCAAMTIYTLIGIYFEEKKLVKEYGPAYNAYRAKVPALIPKL